MHIVYSDIPEDEGNNRKPKRKSKARESARIWVRRQSQRDEQKALKEFADRIEAIRKHYPDFK